jgi:hypothetical protein
MSSLILALALLATPQQTSAPGPPTPAAQHEDPAVTALALKIYAQMRNGKVDESLMTAEMSQTFTPTLLAQEKPIFDQLGDPTRIAFQTSEAHTRGTLYTYQVTFAAAQFHVKIFIHKDGKFAGYGLEP